MASARTSHKSVSNNWLIDQRLGHCQGRRDSESIAWLATSVDPVFRDGNRCYPISGPFEKVVVVVAAHSPANE